jgi:hypothetical protein
MTAPSHSVDFIMAGSPSRDPITARSCLINIMPAPSHFVDSVTAPLHCEDSITHVSLDYSTEPESRRLYYCYSASNSTTDCCTSARDMPEPELGNLKGSGEVCHGSQSPMDIKPARIEPCEWHGCPPGAPILKCKWDRGAKSRGTSVMKGADSTEKCRQSTWTDRFYRQVSRKLRITHEPRDSDAKLCLIAGFA